MAAPSARHNAESQGECEHDRRARMTGLQRTSCLADDMRVGQRIALLLRRFLIALHKRLERFLSLSAFCSSWRSCTCASFAVTAIFCWRAKFWPTLSLALGDVIVASIGLRDAGEFLKQLRLEFRHRISKINDGYMVRAELVSQNRSFVWRRRDILCEARL